MLNDDDHNKNSDSQSKKIQTASNEINILSEKEKYFCKFCSTMIRINKCDKKNQCAKCFEHFHLLCNQRVNKSGKSRKLLRIYCNSCLLNEELTI